jgi:multiple sugar transport system ATP-binding protein
MTIRTDGDQTFSHGDDVYLTPDPTRIYRFDAAGLAL